MGFARLQVEQLLREGAKTSVRLQAHHGEVIGMSRQLACSAPRSCSRAPPGWRAAWGLSCTRPPPAASTARPACAAAPASLACSALACRRTHPACWAASSTSCCTHFARITVSAWLNSANHRRALHCLLKGPEDSAALGEPLSVTEHQLTLLKASYKACGPVVDRAKGSKLVNSK